MRTPNYCRKCGSRLAWTTVGYYYNRANGKKILHQEKQCPSTSMFVYRGHEGYYNVEQVLEFEGHTRDIEESAASV